jgi:hypothetical protein
MTEQRLMQRLRAANPVPFAAEPSGAHELLARIVAQPGDRRLVVRRRRLPRWLQSPRRLGLVAAMFVLVAAGGTAGVGLLAHDGPVELFSDNPAGTPGTGIWHQTVIPASVHRARTFSITGVGRLTLWVAQSRQRGICTALRLPDGDWAGLGSSPLDDGGTAPGCQPTRAQVNRTGRVYQLDGFQYDEALVRGSGGTVWRIEYGRVTPRRGAAVSVRDLVSRERVPVAPGGWFAIALRDRDPSAIPHWRLQALGAGGRVVAQEPQAGA